MHCAERWKEKRRLEMSWTIADCRNICEFLQNVVSGLGAVVHGDGEGVQIKFDDPWGSLEVRHTLCLLERVFERNVKMPTSL